MFSAMLVVHSFLPGQLKAAMQMNWMKPDKWSLSHGAVDSGLVNAVGKPLVQTLETSMRLSDATKLKRMFFHHQNWKIKMKSKHFLHARPPACTKLQPRRDAKQGPCASRNPVLLQMQIPLLHHPARKKIENKSVRGSISRKQTCRVSARKHPSTKNGPRVSLRTSCPPVYRAVTTKKNTAQMGVHDQQQQSSNSYSILRLRCSTANLVSNKVSRTRVWDNVEWTTKNQAHEWIWINTEATAWPILLVSEDNRNTNQHTIGCSRNRARHQSNNLTCHNDSNRS